jgi:hypothetical protein
MKIFISLVILFFSSVIHADENKGYDQNKAIQVASALTSDDRFVMYPIRENVLFSIASEVIIENLESAKKDKFTLAILGPNYGLNYDSYKHAINNVEPGRYAGVKVIFIGDKNNFEELTALSERAGISFKASTCCSK